MKSVDLVQDGEAITVRVVSPLAYFKCGPGVAAGGATSRDCLATTSSTPRQTAQSTPPHLPS